MARSPYSVLTVRILVRTKDARQLADEVRKFYGEGTNVEGFACSIRRRDAKPAEYRNAAGEDDEVADDFAVWLYNNSNDSLGKETCRELAELCLGGKAGEVPAWAREAYARFCAGLAREADAETPRYLEGRDEQIAPEECDIVSDENGNAVGPPEEDLDIRYRCPGCGHRWEEQWPSACDSECPECGMRNITALQYKEQGEGWTEGQEAQWNR